MQKSKILTFLEHKHINEALSQSTQGINKKDPNKKKPFPSTLIQSSYFHTMQSEQNMPSSPSFFCPDWEGLHFPWPPQWKAQWKAHLSYRLDPDPSHTPKLLRLVIQNKLNKLKNTQKVCSWLTFSVKHKKTRLRLRKLARVDQDEAGAKRPNWETKGRRDNLTTSTINPPQLLSRSLSLSASPPTSPWDWPACPTRWGGWTSGHRGVN